MKSASIKLQNIGLNIPIYSAESRRLLKRPKSFTKVGGMVQTDDGRTYVSALQNINLTMKPGENLAILGHNGSGKTTLLRLIAGIYPPTFGTIETKGDIGSLFGLGLGAQPDMTGLEVIRSHLLISNIERNFWQNFIEEIIDFTELGPYVNLPIRTYSSGMSARLFAAMATSAEHDILLIDEGISAGDARFQSRFSDRLSNFMQKASILVLASHNLGFLKQHCSQCLVMEKGEIKFTGGVAEGIEFYKSIE